MFYAHFVLSKKGPLAKVWLAAHWERKLTKTHVFETNIEETVDDILNPKVKLALRTSGHLLLGVVRIYSRKAKYLLQDCNDALGRIKLAFRPISIDLPADSRAASKNAITLTVTAKDMVPKEYTMTEIDFDMDFEELSDNELNARFKTNQAHEDAITMKETIVGMNKVEYDNTLVDDFGPFSMEDFPPADKLRNEEGRRSPLFGPRNLFGDLEEEVDKPENGYEFDPMADEPMFDVVPVDSLTDGEPVPPVNAENVMAEIEKEGPNADQVVANGELSPNGVNDMENVVPEPAELSVANASARNSLEPKDLIINKGQDRMRVKRKRKLLVDEQKTISSDQMRAQLQDTSDIVRTLDMAPSTLKLMFIKENNTVDKLWNMPCCAGDDFEAPGLSHKLVAMFADRNLVPVMEEADEEGLDDFFPVGQSIDVARSMNHDFDTTIVGPEVPYVEPDSLGEQRSKRSRLDDDSLPVPFFDDMNNLPPAEIEPFEEERNLTGKKKKPNKVAGESDEESLDEDTHPEDQDRMSRRTKVVFEDFANLLNRRHTPRHSNPDGSQSVNFKELVRGHQTRKEVAQRFYSALVLKKLQAVDVEQAEPYGDIWLKKGGRYAQFDV